MRIMRTAKVIETEAALVAAKAALGAACLAATKAAKEVLKARAALKAAYKGGNPQFAQQRLGRAEAADKAAQESVQNAREAHKASLAALEAARVAAIDLETRFREAEASRTRIAIRAARRAA